MPEHIAPEDQQPTTVQTVQLTPEQQRARRNRSIVLALVLGAMAILFFVATLDKLGGNLVGIDAIRDL